MTTLIVPGAQPVLNQPPPDAEERKHERTALLDPCFELTRGTENPGPRISHQLADLGVLPAVDTVVCVAVVPAADDRGVPIEELIENCSLARITR